MSDATLKWPPDRVYCGRSYQEGRAAAHRLDAELVVISAGYGLVSERDEVAPYSLTVVSGKADSIANKVPTSEWSPNAWWRALGENTPAKTRLCTLLTQIEPDLILMSLSAGYAQLVADELRALTQNLKPRLRIFCAGTNPPIPHLVGNNIMPYDDRLDGPHSPIRGTMSDFSCRALHHYARCLRDGLIRGVNLVEDKADLVSMMAGWASPEKPRRKRQTDEKIVTFILDSWCQTGGRLSTSFRLLKDSGHACEQGRFSNLFRQAIIQREERQKDVHE